MTPKYITVTYCGLTLTFPADVATGLTEGETLKSYATVSNLMSRLEVYNHIHTTLGLPTFTLEDVKRESYARN